MVNYLLPAELLQGLELRATMTVATELGVAVRG